MAASFARTPGHEKFHITSAARNAVMDLTSARANGRTRPEGSYSELDLLFTTVTKNTRYLPVRILGVKSRFHK